MRYILITILFTVQIGIVKAQGQSSKNNFTIDQNGNVRCNNGASVWVKDLLEGRGIKPMSLSYNAAIPSVCYRSCKG